MSSIEIHSKLESVPIQIPNNQYNNINNDRKVNAAKDNHVVSHNSIHNNNRNNCPSRGSISNQNTQHDQISNSFTNSYPTLVCVDHTVSQPIIISQEKILENSLSSSFQNNNILNSFESGSINNVLYSSNNMNHLSQSLFSGSLPTGNLITNNNDITDNGATSRSYHYGNVPSKTTQYIEDFGTNTTTTPTQYFKDHRTFHHQSSKEPLQQHLQTQQFNDIYYGTNTVNDSTINYTPHTTPTLTNKQNDKGLNTNNNNHICAKEKKHLLDIVEFPTEELLKMMTALLEKIVSSNDELNMSSSNNSSPIDDNDTAPSDMIISTTTNKISEDNDSELKYAISCFAGKHIPQISIEQYLLRIQKYCPTTNDIFLSILVYFDRISKKCNNNDNNSDINQLESKHNFVMNSYNIHRLLISAVTVSTKFFSDFFYSNARYARVGGIPLQEMNKLEIQFMLLCDFKLSIPIEELQRYADLLYTFWNTNNEECVNNIALDNTNNSNA